MRIVISGDQIEVTNAIRDYAEAKFSSVVKLFPQDDTSGSLMIELSKNSSHHQHGHVYTADARVHLRGKDVTIQATEDDLYKAIDLLKDKVTRDLTDHKDKRLTLFKKGAHVLKKLLRKEN